MVTLESLNDEYREYFGTLVLNTKGELCRLVGIEDDSIDYYYVMDNFQHQRREHHSCVGHCIVLKNRIDEREYQMLVGMFNASSGFVEQAL